MFSKQEALFDTYSTRRQNRLVFGLLWALIFLLYLPAARAGFVVDFTGWLDQVKNQPFLDYINRTHFSVKSLYQLTQFVSWVFYKLFGTCTWAWHLLFVSLQALNAALLFRLLRHLASVSGVQRSSWLAFTGVLFFCICPHISEVVVWEPSFHYLLGLLMILGILHFTRRFIETGQRKYSFWALGIFFLSVFSLEYFYLTPFFVLTYVLYLQFAVKQTDKFRQVLLYIILPTIVMVVFRTLIFRLIYGHWVSRAGEKAFLGEGFVYFIKPLKYFFHVLFMGRFWSMEARSSAYHFLEAPGIVYLFYLLFVLATVMYFRHFNRTSAKLKLAGLLLLWTCFGAVIVSPMWFPDTMLLQMDRYAYLMVAFCFPMLVLILSLLPRWLFAGILALYAMLHIGFTIKLNRYWYLSERIIHDMLREAPDPGNKIVILLNSPECFNGVPMIQACTHGEFQLMHDLLLPGKKLKSTYYEMASFNLTTYWDGANVHVLTDSTVKVTLNQWGTWWWRDGKGGVSHGNQDYKLDMRDQGHWYELTLKKPKENYILLYLIDGHLKQVNLDWKEGEQY